MIPMTDPSAGLAIDINASKRLRARASTDPGGALREAAAQFESLLLGMMLKSMRDATGGDSPLESGQTRFFTSMLDQQLAQTLAGRGMGFGELIMRQLGGAAAGPGDAAVAPAPVAVDRAPPRPGIAPAGSVMDNARDFANRMWPHAVEASRSTGIPARFIVAQAALESGWGRAEIRNADGTSSYNVFGIKAGRGWSGPVAEAATLEYVNGAPGRSVERFRSYGSYGEAFLDFARLLRSEPRYAAVIADGRDLHAFAHGLAKAGYATDPAYAEKLLRIINGPALRQALVG